MTMPGGVTVGVSVGVTVDDLRKMPIEPEASADGGTDMIVVLDERIRLSLGDRQEAGGGQDVGRRKQDVKCEKQNAGSKLQEIEAES
jgi:hypothetical protein